MELTRPGAEDGRGGDGMSKKPTRKITVRVTPQTAYNLELLMAMSGVKSVGRVIDKLVRDRMVALKGHREEH